MKRVLLTFAAFIATIFVMRYSFASFLDETYLRVNFHNDTKYTCKSTSTYLRRGYWYHNPPESVAPGASDYWGGSEANYYGPDMAVKFKCGDYSFIVRNQQNYAVWAAGDQNCSTSDVDEHLSVVNKQTRHASCWYNTAGIADVTVSLRANHLKLNKTVNKLQY